MDNITMEQREKSIVERLDEITSKITSVEDWENYISKYQQPFCQILAGLETEKNSIKNL